MKEITSNSSLVELGERSIGEKTSLLPETWLRESRARALSHVYTPEVLAPIIEAVNKDLTSLKPINLSEEYLKDAGALARERAIQAAYRLQAVWARSLEGN